MWSLLRKDHIFRLGIAVAALTLAPYLAAPSAEAASDYAARHSDLPLILVAILACQWGRRRQPDRAARRFWDLWSAGLACWLAVPITATPSPFSCLKK